MTNPAGLRLTIAQMREIIAHCNAAKPNEACGIIAGSGGQVTRVYHTGNEENSPVSYRVKSDDLIRVMQEIERDNLVLMAIYHSHPTSEPVPSQRDVAQACYPEALHLIVSVKGRPTGRVYRIVGGRVAEVSLVVEGET